MLFVVLSVRVINLRRSGKIPLGTAGDAASERRGRAHANFAEYAPFALLLLALADLRGASAILLHPLCAAPLAGRALHAWGMSQPAEDHRYRTVGMVLTFAVILGTALVLLTT